MIVISFSYKFKELFPNSINLTLFRAKKGIFDFLTYKSFEIYLLLFFCLIQEFFEESCLFFILVWLLSKFSYKFKELFPNSVNLTLLGPKREFCDFFDLEIFWNLFYFPFLIYTRIFWRTLSIFHFNLIVIWFSYMFKELFQNSANFIQFVAKNGDFWFYLLIKFVKFIFFLFFVLCSNFLKNAANFSF